MPALSALNPVTNTPSAKNMDETKKFLCGKCKACFTQFETLKRHTTFYCLKSKIEDNNVQTESATRASNATTLTSTPNTSSNVGTAPNISDLLAFFQQQRSQMSSHSSLLDPNFGSNTIILPVGHHQMLDQSLIQIVGPAQTIIPVAIGRSLPSVSKPLLLDGNLTQSLQLPAGGRIPLNPLTPSDFHLPLAFIQPFSPLNLANSQLAAALQQNRQQMFCPQNGTNAPTSQSATATATVTSLNALSPSLICANSRTSKKQRARSALSTAPQTPSKRRCSSADKPLDLSTTSNVKSDESARSSSETMDAEVEKPPEKRFSCDCGVSFLSADTLNSHRKYYCRFRVVDEAEEQEMARKVPSRCSQCDYVPATHAQLAQHVRHKHCSIQAYVCLLCGYKGYSARGIKNHLRCSHADEMLRRKEQSNEEDKEVTSSVLSDSSLLQDYVFCVTDKTQQMPCPKCRSTFPTEHLLHNHNCPVDQKTKQSTDEVTDENEEDEKMKESKGE